MAGDGPEAGLVVVVLGDHLREAGVAEAPDDPAARGQRLDLREIERRKTPPSSPAPLSGRGPARVFLSLFSS